MKYTDSNIPKNPVGPFILSRNPEKAIQEMMETISNLQKVYIKETEALEKSDTDSFLNLQEEKLTAAHYYQDHISQIIQRRDEMRGLDPSLRRKLENMHTELSETGIKNMRAIERMKRGLDRLAGTLRDAAKKEAEKKQGLHYGATGHIRKARNKALSTGSISETV